MAEINFFHALALWVYSDNLVKQVRAFSGWDPTQRWDLNYWSMAFADRLWSVIAPALWLKMISDVLDTNSIHLTCTTHHCLHGQLCMPCTWKKAAQINDYLLLMLEHANFSLHEKWNNCINPYLTVSTKQTKHERLENTPLGLTLGFHQLDICDN